MNKMLAYFSNAVKECCRDIYKPKLDTIPPPPNTTIILFFHLLSVESCIRTRGGIGIAVSCLNTYHKMLSEQHMTLMYVLTHTLEM